MALKEESGICLRCGAPVDLPGERADLPGKKLPGGEPNAAALQPSRKRRASSKGRKSSGAKKNKTTKSSDSDDDGN
mgnify:FL=1